MTLTLDLPAELQLRLANEARQHGQTLDQYARVLLERGLEAAESSEENAGVELWHGISRRSPEDLLALAREQGVGPATSFDEMLGGWPEDDDVDAFLQARRCWQWEGRVPGRISRGPRA